MGVPTFGIVCFNTEGSKMAKNKSDFQSINIFELNNIIRELTVDDNWWGGFINRTGEWFTGQFVYKKLQRLLVSKHQGVTSSSIQMQISCTGNLDCVTVKSFANVWGWDNREPYVPRKFSKYYWVPPWAPQSTEVNTAHVLPPANYRQGTPNTRWRCESTIFQVPGSRHKHALDLKLQGWYNLIPVPKRRMYSNSLKPEDKGNSPFRKRSFP